MTVERARMELEIRDAEAHESNNVDSDGDVTVVEDTGIHDELEGRTDDHRVYIEHDHDQGYDVTVHHTRQGDDDFSGETEAGSVTLGSGQASGTVTFSGPIGQLRFKTTAPSGAITSGSLVVELLSKG